MELKSDQDILQAERADFKKRGPLIVRTLRDNLADSALVNEKAFTQSDVQMTRKAMILAAPYAHPKVFPSYWEHIIYSSILAKHIAQAVGSEELQPFEAEVLQFIGDNGSLAVPHIYYRKNVVSQLFDKDIGVRPELIAKQPPIPEILGRKKAIQDINDLTLPQVILDLADNLGKLNPDGTPFSISQMQRYDETQARRYTGGIFSSQRFGLRALTERGKQKVAIDLLFAEMDLLRNNFAIDIEEICWNANGEFSLVENQKYLRLLQQSQETLDQKTDKELGRAPISKVVFDFGGVMIGNADSAFVHNLAAYFQCSVGRINSIFERLNPNAMANKISEEEYLREFYKSLNLPEPATLEQARQPFIQPEIYHPIPQIQEIIRRLVQKSISLYILSDAIHVVTQPIKDTIRNSFPEVPQKNILISSQISASKRDTENPAFAFLMATLGNPDPSTVLFIDDNARYSTAFRANFGGKALHYGENDPERLIMELTNTGLI